MAEVLPVYKPGQAVSMTASTAVTGGQLVEISGPNAVAAAAAASKKVFGQAAFDAKAGERVTVHRGGVLRCTASGAVVAGDLVVTAAAGKVATAATPDPLTLVGRAITTAADGATVEVATD